MTALGRPQATNPCGEAAAPVEACCPGGLNVSRFVAPDRDRRRPPAASGDAFDWPPLRTVALALRATDNLIEVSRYRLPEIAEAPGTSAASPPPGPDEVNGSKPAYESRFEPLSPRRPPRDGACEVSYSSTPGRDGPALAPTSSQASSTTPPRSATRLCTSQAASPSSGATRPTSSPTPRASASRCGCIRTGSCSPNASSRNCGRPASASPRLPRRPQHQHDWHRDREALWPKTIAGTATR